MLVYGDVERIERAQIVRDEVLACIKDIARLEPGLRQHAALVNAFIRTGELVQGLTDAQFERDGADHFNPLQQAGGKLLLSMAHSIGRSWDSGFAEITTGKDWPELTRSLQGAGDIRTRRAEGYGLYALYPEGFLEAARNSGLGPQTLVIGIRSIGTGLGAMVAAGLGAQPAISVRPLGHPFARRIEIAPDLAEKLLEDRKAAFAIVDEGPGLSGSSLNGVADWLEENGVSPERVHFFPSHGGDLGPKARPEHRQRWNERPRHVLGLDTLLIDTPDPSHRLAEWLAQLLGPLEGELEDISGGLWRKKHDWDETAYPPSDMQMEKRKFLAKAGGKSFLVKFAGLGNDTPRKLARAQQLAGAGFSPPFVGLCHGFLVEEWLAAPPLSTAPLKRADLLAQMAHYLHFRAKNFPAEHYGASPGQLFEMAVHNTRLALGEAASAALAKRLAGMEGLPTSPVETDNRLHGWEWLVKDGNLIKTDGIDHNRAHDLIGCQDIAWDIAGAIIEHDLDDRDATDLIAEVGANPELVAHLVPCYLAFQIGLWTYAGYSLSGADKARVETLLGHYRGKLGQQVFSSACLEA